MAYCSSKEVDVSLGQGQAMCWIRLPIILILRSQYPRQKNGYDCGVYSLLYVIHLMHAHEVNDSSVPKQYHIPETIDNLNGFRLMLLEEMELRRLGLS